MIWLPTLEQVVRIHSRLIERTGGSDGVRGAGLIESAIMWAIMASSMATSASAWL